MDIRTLTRSHLPEKVDIVVGSPPCTEFSFSNRGGSGNIADGLKDIEKFLEVVETLRPRAWAMENVPRVANILQRELGFGGSLSRFSHLVSVIDVLDAAEWGVPQSRKRMIAGDFDFDLLKSYKTLWPTRTLGHVIDTLRQGKLDPVYGWPATTVTDNIPEEPLDLEEERLNRESKTFHRVYNKMSFPDRMDRPARTVTALCTRVSRESIVIDAGDSRYRRLSVRERACLQSFPVAYQFLGNTYSARIKMVGNAIPPLLAFNVVQALLGTPAEEVRLPECALTLAAPAVSMMPSTPTRRFNANRTFAAAIPGLRFGSGVRFELGNQFTTTGGPSWETRFFYGTSKEVRQVALTPTILPHTSCKPIEDWMRSVTKAVIERIGKLPEDSTQLQQVWTHQASGDGPFEVVDALGELSSNALALLNDLQLETGFIECLVGEVFDTDPSVLKQGPSIRKLLISANSVLAGLMVCTTFNMASKLSSINHANR